jgi:predicted Fe-Mo cluster-binding NifX family protein
VAAEVVVERELWISHAVDGLWSTSQPTRPRNHGIRGPNKGIGADIGADKQTAGRTHDAGEIGLKIAVSTVGDSLDSQIDPRFGRCPYFVIVDANTMGFEAIPNTSQYASSGAGIQAAQTITNKGVRLVLTGSVGPNAFQVLSSAGVEIITSVSGTVREAVEKFKGGQLRETTATPTTMGFGMGGGYGMGMGRGRGMGFKRWQATGPYVPPMTSPPLTPPTPAMMPKAQEIQMLDGQMKALQLQLEQIRKRLEELKS